MAEQVTLTTPVTYSSTTSWRICFLHLNWDDAFIDICVKDQNGRVIKHSYTGSEALTLMTTLNTANLTTNSLHKRALTKLQADGVLGAGTISGTPS